LKRNSTPSPAKSPSHGPEEPRRGDVWWVRLDPTFGSEIKKTRPCLVVTTNVLNRLRRTVVVIPLSTSPQAAPPILVPISCQNRPAVAVVDQIRAVAKERLLRRLDTISPEHLQAIEEGLRQILEL
jgi:mRNA interferase MazF